MKFIKEKQTKQKSHVAVMCFIDQPMVLRDVIFLFTDILFTAGTHPINYISPF